MVTLVVAAAGYGKTEAAEGMAEGARWFRGATATELIRGGLPDPCPPALVVDDPPVPPAELGRWLERAADALPLGVRLIVLSRHPVPVPRLRAHGRVAELGAAELALTAAQVRSLLATDFGLGDPWLAGRVYEATAGWPALVRLAAKAIAADGEPEGDLAKTLAEQGKPLARFLAVEVLAGLPPPIRRVVRALSRLELITEDLGLALGESRAAEALAELSGRGLLQPVPDGHRLVPVLAQVATRNLPLSDVDTRTMLSAAARWYLANSKPGPAARAFLAAAEQSAAAAVLETSGGAVLASEGADAVLRLTARLPHGRARTLLRAEALAMAGDIDAAQAACDPLDDGGDAIEPALARILGHLEYRRGQPRKALRQYARAGGIDALLLAWTAVAHWAAGDERNGRRSAAQAAAAAKNDRELAASHLALGFAAELAGERAAEHRHYARALELAESAGDVVTAAQIRTNQASRALGEADYAAAERFADQAIALAERVGYLSVLGIALCESGEALLWLGQPGAATERFERALALEHRTGSRRLAAPLTGLGDVYRVLGRPNLARARYEEAVRICGAEGDRRGLLPALTGLAAVLAGSAPSAAAGYADRARREAAGSSVIAAVLAQAWVALGAGDRDRAAAALAEDAAEAARLHRDRARLAEALELAARTETQPSAARRALTEAQAIWRDTGARIAAWQVTVLLGELPGAPAGDRLDARLARQSLADAGVNEPTAAAGVEIRTLGRFEVRVNGEPLPASAWPSGKARDLLRILICRRGRGIAREELADLLWGGEDPALVGHRLSVALSTVRAALGTRCVVADQTTVALNASAVSIDLEEFLLTAEHGFRLDPPAAVAVLTHAERRYGGDLFEDEPYDDWASAIREEARATYLRVVRTLADLSDVDERIRYLHRILAVDPYDEQGHRDLVDALTDAGRHGEAHRARARYAKAMRRLRAPGQP